jgi:hypothetical protein
LNFRKITRYEKFPKPKKEEEKNEVEIVNYDKFTENKINDIKKTKFSEAATEKTKIKTSSKSKSSSE